MKGRCLLFAVTLSVILASQPLRGDINLPKVDIPFGILVSDVSCSEAMHALRDVCTGMPNLYVVFPKGKNVEQFENRNVTLRGTLELTICSLPLLRATRIAESNELPPCPFPCEPGDPPPCPQ